MGVARPRTSIAGSVLPVRRRRCRNPPPESAGARGTALRPRRRGHGPDHPQHRPDRCWKLEHAGEDRHRPTSVDPLGQVAPIRAVAGPQRQYHWSPTAIMGGPQSVEYSGHWLVAIYGLRLGRMWASPDDHIQTILRVQASGRGTLARDPLHPALDWIYPDRVGTDHSE